MATPEPSKAGLRLNITLVYSPAPRQVREWQLELEAGATVIQALAACGIFEEFPALAENRLLAGIWGRRIRPDHLLADKDRIEIYRPLRVDPKTARRERFDRQGAKSAGLFTVKRPGSKAGY
ncbi:RnfH family protein [Polaromonas sp.]|uniref:RnfH family protein n=1 Tax=Polaromonas sp. TaxID=1869339 RepID=UPI0013BAB50B|nr:RnfH family protein [Polaromonas sp.]NDP62257.1 RnfH family protein [Polaromonas sp.]